MCVFSWEGGRRGRREEGGEGGTIYLHSLPHSPASIYLALCLPLPAATSRSLEVLDAAHIQLNHIYGSKAKAWKETGGHYFKIVIISCVHVGVSSTKALPLLSPSLHLLSLSPPVSLPPPSPISLYLSPSPPTAVQTCKGHMCKAEGMSTEAQRPQ